jgi:hypothetical protein
MRPWGGPNGTIVLDILGYEKSDKNIRNSTNHTADIDGSRADVSATLPSLVHFLDSIEEYVRPWIM